jgi:hypothetical protein
VHHRQVEAAAVPRHQVRREALDALEEALQQFLLAARRIAEAPQLQRIPAPQRTGDRHDALLGMGQEFAAGALAAQGEHGAGGIGVGKAREAQRTPAIVHVRHGLDVEHQVVHRRAACISAFISRTASAMPVNSARPMMA